MTCSLASPVASGDRDALSEDGSAWACWAVGQGHAFGHHHQPVRPPARHLLFQARRHHLQIAGNLGNQHGVGANGDARLQRHPSGLLAQHLHHGDLAGRLGRLASPVEHLDGEAEGAVEAEGHRRGGDVVLDRAGDAHHRQPLALQLVEDAQPAAANDGNQRIDLLCLQPCQQLVGHVHFFDHVICIDRADVKRIDPARLAQDAAGGRDRGSRPAAG